MIESDLSIFEWKRLEEFMMRKKRNVLSIVDIVWALTEQDDI